MKIKRISLFLSFFVLSSVLLSAADKKVIVFGGDVWMPFQGGSSEEYPGYMNELLKEIYSSHGYTVEFKNLPWKRAIEYAEEGKIDALFGGSAVECARLQIPTQEIFYLESTTFFVHSGNSWRYKGISSLDAVSFGYIEGYDYGKEFNEYLASKKGSKAVQGTAGADPLKTLIYKLKEGRIDVVFTTPAALRWRMKELGISYDEFIEAGTTKEEQQKIYIGFYKGRKDSAELARVFSKEIVRYRANGKLKRYLERYGLKDWK